MMAASPRARTGLAMAIFDEGDVERPGEKRAVSIGILIPLQAATWAIFDVS